MRTARVRLVGAISALAVFGVVGCQKTMKLAVDNRCDAAIEVDIDDAPDPVGLGYEHDWKAVQQDEVRSLRSAPDQVRRVYVWVRPSGSAETPEPLVFESSDLETSDNKTVAVIVGDLCP